MNKYLTEDMFKNGMIEVGKIIPIVVEKHANKENGRPYMIERVEPFKSSQVILNIEKLRPLALITKDCRKEAVNFSDKFALAEVGIDKGYFVINSFSNNNGIVHVISEIVSITESHSFCIDLEIKYIVYPNDKIPEGFEKTIYHIENNMINNDIGDYVPRVSINISRIYEIRLFENDKGLRSISDVNKTFVLNKKSKEYDGSSGKIMHIFYNKKYADSEQIFVDGFTLSLPTIEQFILKYKLIKDIQVRKEMEKLVELTTKSGFKFLAFTNTFKDTYEGLYNSMTEKGYSKFTLNKNEKEFIEKVEKIKLG